VQSAIRKARPGMALWANTETFQDGFQTMPIHAIVRDMCVVQADVSNYLSFSFNHYLSPQQANPLYYQAYLDYLRTGRVESFPPTSPANLSGTAVDSATIQLSWTGSTDNLGVVGYKIFRDGKRVANVYDAATTFIDSGLRPGATYSYQIEAFDAAGNMSVESNSVTLTTPPPHLYPVNLSLGKPYSATMQADAGYPDTASVELTDGVLDSANYSDPAWQGRATTKGYSFTIDLGALQEIREIRSEWLQDIASGIFLPKQVTCSVSADDLNFTVAGIVKSPSAGDETKSTWYTLTDLAGLSGRYVQLRVTPGSSAEWTFVDEIEVRQ
jgi:chitodextrinase